MSSKVGSLLEARRLNFKEKEYYKNTVHNFYSKLF